MDVKIKVSKVKRIKKEHKGRTKTKPNESTGGAGFCCKLIHAVVDVRP